ncbi:MAG: FeoA family protein [Bacillota bacterium]
MELALANNIRENRLSSLHDKPVNQNLNLTEANINSPYVIKGVDTKDENMKEFLFTLGCYEGETITVLSLFPENYVINVKDSRYSIDEDLARAILI